MLKIYNSLTKQVEVLRPIDNKQIGIYSCGPTVYDHVHIGNLSAFIFADTLRRVICANDLRVKHVMNFTDVDDKTIRRSHEQYPEDDPREALRKVTEHYTELFLNDTASVGNDKDAYTFISATEDRTIESMKKMIQDLLISGFAYAADDGVYFSIDAYKKSGKIYGQLINVTASSDSRSRIASDEYDKESAQDFSLWKKQKDGEPSWDFEIDGQDFSGRPGWTIECSVMSKLELGQPFDIHTGGVDLIFPHHENEIAQSTAGQKSTVYANMFVHNEHILVDGRKMSKSLGNFYTLGDLVAKGVDPLAFRLLVLQSHYRSQTNFSFENAQSSMNRLQHWRDIANLRWQTHDTLDNDDEKDSDFNANGIILAAPHAALEALNEDLKTPEALACIEHAFEVIDSTNPNKLQHSAIAQLIEWLDQVFGLRLAESTPDISDAQKQIILERERARENKNWKKSDELRGRLVEQGISLKDTAGRTIWTRILV